MAVTIDYTGLFTTLGHLDKLILQLDADQTDLHTRGQTYYDSMTSAQSPSKVTGLNIQNNIYATLTAFKGNYAAAYPQLLIDFVASPNSYYTTAYSTLNSLLYTQMIADSQTIKSNTVTAGSITLGGTNVGSIDVWRFLQRSDSKINSSSDPFQNEFIYSQNWTLVCTSDRYSGSTAGREQFALNGQTVTQDFQDTFGGQGAKSLTVNCSAAGSSIIANGGFESYSTNTPSGWTLTGVAGTNITIDTSTFYRDLASLKILLAGGTGPYGVSQAIKPQASTTYLVILKIKGGTVASDASLAVTMTGTGYTAGTTEHITYTSTISTSWTTKSFFWNSPAQVPANMSINILLTGTTTTSTVFIDEVMLIPVTLVRGVGFVLTAKQSANDSIAGDNYSFAITNDYAGKFQTFFARNGFSLPSSGSPTISDSLVT